MVTINSRRNFSRLRKLAEARRRFKSLHLLMVCFLLVVVFGLLLKSALH